MGLRLALLAGRSGVMTASTGVNTVSNDIAGAADPAYARRIVQTSSAVSVRRGSSYLGTGTQVDRISRSTDDLLAKRAIAERGSEQLSLGLSGALAPLETIVDPTGSDGLRARLDQWYDALGKATVDPTDGGLRGEVLARTQSLVDGFQTSHAALDTVVDDANSRVPVAIGRINQRLAEIGAINEARVAGRSGEDLMDRRDAALDELADLTGTTADLHADGTVTVFLGGHALVDGGNARPLHWNPADDTIHIGSPTNGIDISTTMGGQVGGWLAAREKATTWLADLNTTAKSFADAVNAVHSTGFGMDGVNGRPLFSYVAGQEASTLSIDASMVGQPDRLAFASIPTSSGDGTTLRSLMALEDTALIGTQKVGDALTSFVGAIGTSIAEADLDATAAGSRRGDLDALLANLESVDLDEAAAKLMEWRSAWQASSRVIKVADELMGELMRLV